MIELINQLYAEHLSVKQETYLKALETGGFRRLIIGSGSHNVRFRDDCFTPYFANAYFDEFVSLKQYPNSFLLIKPDSKPKLFVQSHDDYWHSTPEPLDSLIAGIFDIEEYVNQPDIESAARTAFIGPDTKNLPANIAAESVLNSNTIFTYVDYHRAWKTEYEKHCLRQANRTAVKGHRIAEKCFREGCSEYEIHMAYLASIQYTDADLPYDNIIALNENAAVLHHMHYSIEKPDQSLSLLIDAGARYRSYAADISRTYTRDDEHSEFDALIAGVNSLQRQLVQKAHAGKSYLSVHLLAHRLIADLLADLKIIKCSTEEALDSGLTQAFFPHGVGHLLGIQVHDKGGHMDDPQGKINPPPNDHPFLRLTRNIEEGMAFTIEPGVYFIPRLLSQWRDKALLNETLVDQLTPYGGVRIEDNVIAGKSSVENLTRDAFEAAA